MNIGIDPRLATVMGERNKFTPRAWEEVRALGLVSHTGR